MVLPLTLTASALGALNDAREGAGDPTNQGLQARINRGLCDIWASNPNAASLAVGFAGVAVANELCGKYWDDQGTPPPTLEAPFQGGQCAGVLYDVRYEQFFFSGYGLVGGQIQENGSPITRFSDGVRVRRVPGRVEGVVFDRAARTLTLEAGTDSVLVSAASTVYEAVIISVTRVDGQPDTCGDPPGVWQPSPNYPKPRDFGSPEDIGSPGSPDPWVYSPAVDVRGNPYIRVEPATGSPSVGLPAVAIPGGFSDPSFPPEETPPPIEGEPEDIPPGGAGGETGEPSPPETASDEKAVCVGYAWELSGFPSGDSIIVGSDKILPYVAGNLQLILRLDEQNFLRSDNLELSVNRGILITPYEGLPVAGARWTKRQDLALRLIPLYKIVSQEISEV